MKTRFLQGLKDPALTSNLVRHNIAVCVAKLDEEDGNYLETILREVEAQKLATKQVPLESPQRPLHVAGNRPLKTIEERPEPTKKKKEMQSEEKEELIAFIKKEIVECAQGPHRETRQDRSGEGNRGGRILAA